MSDTPPNVRLVNVPALGRKVFQNIGLALAEVGLTFGAVVKLTFFLTDLAHLPQMRAARQQRRAGRGAGPPGTADRGRGDCRGPLNLYPVPRAGGDWR